MLLDTRIDYEVFYPATPTQLSSSVHTIFPAYVHVVSMLPSVEFPLLSGQEGNGEVSDC
jgi:hypothetical protein